MSNEKKEYAQLADTGKLVLALNLLMMPFYLVDRRLGLSASFAITAGALYGCKELGAAKSKEGNPSDTGFFAEKNATDPIEEKFNNMIAGASSIVQSFNLNSNGPS